MQVWVNGRMLPDPDAAAVSVTDHGFTVGDGVFESVKVVDGVPFALSRHVARLAASAAGLELEPPDEHVVRRAVDEVLAAAHLPLGRLRITYTAGSAPLGSGRGDADGTLAVVAAPMQSLPATTAVITVPWTRNERGATAGLKTTSYAENVIALAEARRRGATEAVFANTAGHLCEGTGTNVFYVLDGRLCTPPLASGCLAGVTRALVLEWYGAEQADATLQEVARASEVFLTSTTRSVQGVHRWNDRDLPAPGPVTADVSALWAQREKEHPDPL